MIISIDDRDGFNEDLRGILAVARILFNLQRAEGTAEDLPLEYLATLLERHHESALVTFQNICDRADRRRDGHEQRRQIPHPSPPARSRTLP